MVLFFLKILFFRPARASRPGKQAGYSIRKALQIGLHVIPAGLHHCASYKTRKRETRRISRRQSSMKSTQLFFQIVLVAANSALPLFSRWQQTSGPYGGNISAFLAVDTND